MPVSVNRSWIDLEFLIENLNFRLLPSDAFMVSVYAINSLSKHQMDRFQIAGTPLSDTDCARFIGVSEAMFKAAKPDIINRKIFRQDSDGTLVYEPFETLLKRRNINQINGKKGGRGKKAARSITEKSSDTESQQKSGGLKPVRKGRSVQLPAIKLPASFSKEKEGSSLAATTTTQVYSDVEVRSLAQRAAAIPGLDPGKSKAAHAVRQWLMQGADETLILRVLANKKLPEGKPICSMHWYSPAIKAALGLDRRTTNRAH